MKVALVDCAIRPVTDNETENPESEVRRTPPEASIVNRACSIVEGWEHFSGEIQLEKTCTATALAVMVAEGSDEWLTSDLVMVLGGKTAVSDPAAFRELLRDLLRGDKRVLARVAARSEYEESIGYVSFRPRDRAIQQAFQVLVERVGPNGYVSVDEFNNLFREHIDPDLNDRAAGIFKLLDPGPAGKDAYHGLSGRLLKQLVAEPESLPIKYGRGVRKFNSELKNTRELALRDGLVKTAFLYERVGYDRRPIELMPDGHIGYGAKAFETFWDVEVNIDGAAVLSFCSHHDLTCELEYSGDRHWKGKWIAHEKMPVELRPLGEDYLKNVEEEQRGAQSTSHDFSVSRAFPTVRARPEYDMTFSVLVHCAGKYRSRADAFLKGGLVNRKDHRVHVIFIGSANDGSCAAGLSQECPSNVAFTFLEMNSCCPVPKINGHYIWLLEQELDSRWYVRVDDDSITDVDAMLKFLDGTFGRGAVQMMTSPTERELGEPIFQQYVDANNIPVRSVIHEYESSATSHAAMMELRKNDIAMHFIRDTAAKFAAPGDRTLSIALQICRIPLAINANSTKDCRLDSFSLMGGEFHHIHYINWEKPLLLPFIRMLEEGSRSTLQRRELAAFLDIPLLMVNGLEVNANTITISSCGAIESEPSMEETRWIHHDDRLIFHHPNMMCSIAFDQVVHSSQGSALLGKDLQNGKALSIWRRIESKEMSNASAAPV